MLRRALKDRLVHRFVTLGGLATIIAISIIFGYLFYVVIPLFKPASVEPAQTIKHEATGTPLYYAVEESLQLTLRIADNGELAFIDLNSGSIRDRHQISLAENTGLTLVSDISASEGIFVITNSLGQIRILQAQYSVSFDENEKRHVNPELSSPYGEDWIVLFDEATQIRSLDVQKSDDSLAVVALDENNRLLVRLFDKESSLFDESAALVESSSSSVDLPFEAQQVLLEPSLNRFFLIDTEGNAEIRDLDNPTAVLASQSLTDKNEIITSIKLLNGGNSLLAGDESGTIAQWMVVRDDNNDYSLQRVREFKSDSAIAHLLPEKNRKGFAAVFSDGSLGLYHTTSERKLAEVEIPVSENAVFALAPRSDMILSNSAQSLSLWSIDNQHPEVSLNALFGKVWYEGYDDKQFLWQSTAATGDFEPKYSLTPLLFGTLKAAFYALLLAIPLAIMAAIYTAYFMPARVRRVVKPSIEIMEAIPTVILGFLAGLWLAPLVEKNLPAVFALLMIVPVCILLVSWFWYLIREKTALNPGDGWQVFVLIPVVCLAGFGSFAISPWLEATFFAGDMRLYLAKEWGLDFDQRNALVVGIAMGFAVIPTIFSIAEDALFSVPKHLTQGALALGATPWQTLVRVVLPTASPAIFSASMMGLGRAVGETMIILMATGNTPIMDINIFEGMRTLSANIAVEMPESSVGSTHYRVLFLTALLLFIGTFLFNTLAESVRHRLRKKYSRY